MGGAAAVDRPRRLLPLHDADERAAAGAGGVRARGGATSGRRGSPSTSRGCSPGSSTSATTPTGGTARCARRTTASRCPTMIVAGWADGYRNNTFRTMERLAENGVPRRLLAGPWAHAATSSSLPGPRIDLVPEMVRWWDRWLRGVENGVDAEPEARLVRPRLAPPGARPRHRAGRVARRHAGRASARRGSSTRSSAKPPYVVRPDVGTAAWISCAGHLPYGQPLDQRHDDADSLTWDVDAARPGDRRATRACCCRCRRPRRSRPSRSSSATSRPTARPRSSRAACST